MNEPPAFFIAFGLLCLTFVGAAIMATYLTVH